MRMRRMAAVAAGGLLATGPALVGGGALVASPARLGHPVQPVRGPNGAALRGPVDQVETTNWSGYAVAHFETGLTYTSASGTWVVPSVTPPPGYSSGYSSSWVGVGGFCENAACSAVDSTLIQLGTEQDASSSGATYSAWYELLPSGPVTIPLTVQSGDTVTASLADGPSVAVHGNAKPGHGGHGGGGGVSGQTWTLSMTVTQPSGSASTWSTTVAYNSSLLSAEWIEEAPVGCIGRYCVQLPLADYGTATFDPGTAAGSSPGLVASDAVVAVNPNGETSNPSAPDSDADGFDTCWGQGTALVACSAPTS